MPVYKWDSNQEYLTSANGSYDPSKLRVAAYCRVSTDDQESSFQVQQDHFLDLLDKHKDEWVNAGIYADEGISGTGMRKRKEFLHMLRDCEAGRIDLIITKSISRFARNTVDMLITVRRLKELGVRILFEKECVDTGEAANELFLTFWASFAQAESVSISKNVVAALRIRMERGEGRITNWCSLGYRTSEDKTLAIVPEEAILVRRIFRMYLEGMSEQKIADRLMKENIPAPKGGSTWYGSTVASMLMNEKYMGDFLFQKTFTKDTLTHAVFINDGRLPQFYSTGHHEPIIPREIFYRAQGERAWRAARRNTGDRYYNVKEPLQGKVICGICGRIMKRVTFPDGKIEWRCRRRSAERRTDWKENVPACPCRNADQAQIYRAIENAIRKLPELREDIDMLLSSEPPEYVQKIQRRLNKLVDAEQNREKYFEKISLYASKAEYERNMTQLRVVKEVADYVAGEGEVAADIGGECSDVEMFYKITEDLCKMELTEGEELSEYMINRLLERNIVYSDYYNVTFKGLIDVEISCT